MLYFYIKRIELIKWSTTVLLALVSHIAVTKMADDKMSAVVAGCLH